MPQAMQRRGSRLPWPAAMKSCDLTTFFRRIAALGGRRRAGRAGLLGEVGARYHVRTGRMFLHQPFEFVPIDGFDIHQFLRDSDQGRFSGQQDFPHLLQ